MSCLVGLKRSDDGPEPLNGVLGKFGKWLFNLIGKATMNSPDMYQCRRDEMEVEAKAFGCVGADGALTYRGRYRVMCQLLC